MVQTVSKFQFISDLKSSGVDFTLRDKKNVTPLLRLAWAEKLPFIQALFNHGVKPEQKYHPSGLTLLHALSHVQYHDFKLLQEICQITGTHCVSLCNCPVDSGININHQDESGYTALHYAAESRNEDMCNILLDLGADVSIQTNKGKTAIMLGLKQGLCYHSIRFRNFVYEMLVSGSPVEQRINDKLLERLVYSNPKSLTAVATNSRNVLHYVASAFSSHSTSILELIFAHSTEEMINQQDQDGNTPLHNVCAGKVY